ncbi:MAG: ATPase, partial [Oscillospiraceae bacterium]|nr:ATPase [Oscillospiraceae bacterium]
RLLSESSVVPSIALGNIAGICFGLPCFGESAEGDRLLSAELSKRFWGTPISIVNDSEVGWAGSLGMNPGVNIVAGTGSIAFGRDASGRTARCGGWSEFFSDEGSCYWLGRKTMGLFSKQADGRLPKNALYDIIREAFSLEEDFAFIDVMEDVTIKHRDKVASMQMLLMRAALSGDGSARDLYVQAAGELAATVAGVAGRLELPPPFPVSYSGGLFKAGDLIMEPFAAKITALGGYLQAPLFSPEYGALLLARERFKSA